MDEPCFVSAYINLDPSDFGTPRERAAQIESLTDKARSDASSKAISHTRSAALGSDIDRVKRWAESTMDAAGAHGVAVFCCSEADVFDVFRLSAPVGPDIMLAETAYLEPLTSALPAEAWFVFLVNRRTSRMLRGSRDRLFEVGSFEDDVHGQHDQGGWSQARYQRSVEKEVKDHVHAACDRLFEVFHRHPFDKLLVGCPKENSSRDSKRPECDVRPAGGSLPGGATARRTVHRWSKFPTSWRTPSAWLCCNQRRFTTFSSMKPSVLSAGR